MLTFVEFLEANHPEFYAEAKKEGLGSRILKLAAKMPYTTTAIMGSAGLLGGTHAYEKSKGSDEHPVVSKTQQEKLPPLKKLKSKVVGTVDDTGRA